MIGMSIGQDTGGLVSAQEFERRMALATPADTMCGFFFNGALAAVRSLGDEAVKRCLEAGQETSFTSFFRYPAAAYLRVTYTAANLLKEQHDSLENALRYVGCMVIPPFLSSAVGRTMLTLNQRNPRLLISSLPTAYRAAVSYGESWIQWTGPRSGLILTKHDFIHPVIHEGALLSLFEVMCAKGVRVRGRLVGALDNEIAFSWGLD
ncbi:TIGR02265 family protein [Archangium violaceum]|uniref:TIGR02265 family protein n=1 Tax=Archangium violaceum TaxID=83451 RepID=UPI00193B8053|nr:TIGR02265 family protein [Archangium violaceum]QRK09143.1 TIGR02265 family protein [Archangium violaceum]